MAPTDVDWAGCKHSHRLSTGYIFSINGAPFFWKSNRQSIIALSTAQAEYVTLSARGKDVVRLRRLGYEVANRVIRNDWINMHPANFEVDSAAASAMASVSTSTKLTKHIDIRSYYIRILVHDKILSIKHVSSANQTANCLTKIPTLNSLSWMISRLKLKIDENFIEAALSHCGESAESLLFLLLLYAIVPRLKILWR